MLKGWRLPFRRSERSGLIVGEGASGKTTLLYALMGMENIVTIPTIGFNVEEIPFKASSKYILWDVGGGCGKIRPLLRYYITPDKFCIFLHDATSDAEFTQDSLNGFRMILEDYAAAGGKHMFVIFTKQDIATDAVSTVSSEEAIDENLSSLAGKFEQIAISCPTGRNTVQVKVLPLPGFSSSKKSCAQQLMSVIHDSLNESEAERSRNLETEVRLDIAGENPKTPAFLSAAADELIAEAELQKADDFWADFSSGNLKSWGHAAHLRAGLGIILHDYLQPRGVFDWTDTFLTHLERLRCQQPHLFRNTTHRTMTTFWLHRIHRALRTYMLTENVNNTLLPVLDDFAHVIRSDTGLADRSVWRQYYYQERMLGVDAKGAWCLPDLKQLSDIVPSSAQLPVAIPSTVSSQSSPTVEGDLRVPRFAFIVIKTSILSGIRRGFLIRYALPALSRVTMQKRSLPLGKEAKHRLPQPYSETQAYFWIQYVHSLLQSVYDAESSTQKPTHDDPMFIPDGMMEALRLDAFQSLCLLAGREWENFYSASIWNSVAARSSFIQPDLEILPNIFPYLTRWNLKQAYSVLVQRKMVATYDDPGDELMEEEEMAFFTELAASQIEYVSFSDEKNTSGERPLRDTRERVSILITIYQILLDAITADDDVSARHGRLSRASVALTATLSSDKGGSYGITHAVFWIRIVGESLLQHLSRGHKPMRNSVDSFRTFLRYHPHLSFPALPQKYYSLELWGSADAKVTYIMPDRDPSIAGNW